MADLELEQIAARAIEEILTAAKRDGYDGARAYLDAEGPIDLSILPSDEEVARALPGECWCDSHPDDARAAVTAVLGRYVAIDEGILAEDLVAYAMDTYRLAERAAFVDEVREYGGSVIRYNHSHNRASA